MTRQIHSDGESALSLDPGRDDIRRWGNAAVDIMATYLDLLRERPVYPKTTSQEIREKLESSLPEKGVEFDRLLEIFNDVIVATSRHNGHPRMFGYVQAPGSALAAIADLLASALNANLTAWRSAPAAVEVERLTIDWIKQILGFGTTSTGLFVSGGSMANLAALAVARRQKAEGDLTNKGVQSLRRAMRLYMSVETHHSIPKAAVLLGLGRDNVRTVAVDKHFKIRIDDLLSKIEEDREAGHQPFFVVANAGTVATGAFDSLREVSEVAQRFNLWMHVDGSYGGFAALAPSRRQLFSAVAEADSIALDPHKWLYLPVDCGCVLYRDPEAARLTFAHEAEYTRVLEDVPDEAFAFWDLGPELSRRFRALKVWMLLKGVGLQALAAAIEKDLACARHLERLVQQSQDFEMLAPVELSIFCFRYVPERLRSRRRSQNEEVRLQAEKELDALNEKLLIALQRDGSSYLSNARLDGRFGLRGCVMNYRTTLHDMEILLEDLGRVATTIV